MTDTTGPKSIAAVVPAKDMQRSLHFYSSLGFSVEPYEDGSDYAFLYMDGVFVHLRRAVEKEFTYNAGGIYLYVTDVDAFYQRAIANGLHTLGQPKDQAWKMREFALSDPDGLLIRIGQNLV